MGDHDVDIWYKVLDPDFIDISYKSRASARWLSYQAVLSSKYGNSIIKPLNWYAANIIAPPRLISINGNLVTLRQHTHADIYLLQKKFPHEEEFYNVDRPWIRQYYQTHFSSEIPDTCFPYIYRFYTPWFIDADVEITYRQPDAGSAFHIYQVKDFWFAPAKTDKHVKPHFVPFSFKKIGPHMEDADFGVIKMPEPMYDIVFEANDIIIEQIKEFYEQQHN